MTTIFATEKYADKILGMQGKGMAQGIKNIVLVGGAITESMRDNAAARGTALHTFESVMEAGAA